MNDLKYICHLADLTIARANHRLDKILPNQYKYLIALAQSHDHDTKVHESFDDYHIHKHFFEKMNRICRLLLRTMHPDNRHFLALFDRHEGGQRFLHQVFPFRLRVRCDQLETDGVLANHSST
ncbi:hypothetical protein [Peribacillus loiseleuriae]|uniref:hypothetical protein n=1 Tax=Peribacillus loiseleuriae TaxID=1679170 RepID=UPI003CFC14F1